MGRVVIVIIISRASSVQFIHCHLSMLHASPDFQIPSLAQPTKARHLVQSQGSDKYQLGLTLSSWRVMNGVSVCSGPALGMTPHVGEPYNSLPFGKS